MLKKVAWEEWSHGKGMTCMEFVLKGVALL
jgi:hypothetical protein